MNTIRRYKIYGLAFIIPTVLLAIVYATRGVYPISNNSVLVLDLNAQYVYYYEAFRDAFYSNKSLLYSFSRTLGGEMVGIYAYYLASPFTFLILLFPKKLITEAVLAMILCKVGCAGLSFFIYLKVTKFAKNHNALIFSTLYALMGYVIVQTMNPMWLDAVLLLPLLIMAVQKLVDEGKYILYICLLTITFISNFYIGYMVGIFLAIYFLCYIFGLTSLENKEIKIVRRMILFTISSITSVLMSLWLIIPTYLALKMGKFTFTNPDFMPEQQIDLFDLFAKALPLSYDSVDYPGLPFIYCGLMTVLLIVLYFLNDAIRPKEKIASVIFMFIVVASFTISTVDIALHGFQAPNWLNYRYSFILSFYMVSIAYDSFVNLKNISGKTIAKASLIIVLLIALTGRNGYEFIEPEITIWFSYTALMIYLSCMNNIFVRAFIYQVIC